MLNRSKAIGAIVRLIFGPSVKLNPRNFRSCGRATALFRLIYFELKFVRDESRDALPQPLTCPLAVH
jgi:hypothetical protein